MSTASSTVPVRLVELWLTLVRGGICRRASGGLLAQLPADSELEIGEDQKARALGILIKDSDQVGLAQDARRFFGKEVPLVAIIDDIKASSRETPVRSLSLRQVLSELQAHLLDAGDDQVPDVELLIFLLKHGEYRSRHISVRRAVYHVVPHEGQWKVQRQGQSEGETYALKDQAVKAGADRAGAHAAGQLIIHAANGAFQEERTYGGDPAESSG